MTADVFQVYAAYCDVCGWESDEYHETASGAENEAEKHLVEHPSCADEDDDPDEPDTYQETLDRLAAGAIANARAAAA